MSQALDPSFRDRWEARVIFVVFTFVLLLASGGGQQALLTSRLPWAALFVYVLAAYSLERQLNSQTKFKALMLFQLQSFSPKNPHIFKTLLWSALGTGFCVWILFISQGNGFNFFSSLLKGLHPVGIVALLALGIPGFMMLWASYFSKRWGTNTSAVLAWILMSTASQSVTLGLSIALMVRLNSFVLEKYGYANLLLASLLQFLFLSSVTLTFWESSSI